MRFRSLRLFVALAAVLAAMAPQVSQAARPEPAPAGGPIRPAVLPIGLSRQPVTVVVQLADEPVAVRQANAGRKLERGERDLIKAQLRSAQSSIHAHIQGLGGNVLGSYQASYNGIKVRIARDKRSTSWLPCPA